MTLAKTKFTASEATVQEQEPENAYWLRLYVGNLLGQVDPQTITSPDEAKSVAMHAVKIAKAALEEIG